jgi:poly(3-hydroxybutyrate) depolymerase
MTHAKLLVRLSVLATALSACLGGCAVTQPQNTPVQARLLTEPATGESYYLYVPSTYRRDKPAPVIVSCHGTDPFDVAAYQTGEWKMLAEQHGCILVCPKLTSTDGILGDGSINSLLHDERTIMAALSDVQYMYNVDRNNILMTGFSGGGFPVYFVALRHPDVFSAVVARNCNFNRRAVEDWFGPEALNQPIMVYWGQNDPDQIRNQSRDAIDYLRGVGFQVETAEIPGVGHERHPEVAMRFWLQHWHGTAPPSALLPYGVDAPAPPAAAAAPVVGKGDGSGAVAARAAGPANGNSMAR